MDYKKKILVDFDGVIHKYRYGWMDGTAYDSPMEGAFEALEQLSDYDCEVVIFSTRDSRQIFDWLKKNGFPSYRVTNVKEPAEVIIDDRAIRFESWNQTFVDLKSLHSIPNEDRRCPNCTSPIGNLNKCPECRADYDLAKEQHP